MRPRAMVFIGNGFTIGLSEYLGVFDWHDTRALLPPTGSIEWIQQTSAEHSLNNTPLWDARRYPLLVERWNSFCEGNTLPEAARFSAFCASLSNERAFQSLGDGSIGRVTTFGSASAAFQLRRYLWHALYELTSRLYETLVSANHCPWPRALLTSTARWPLALALRELAETWDLTLVSFNYEHYLEEVLMSHGCECQHLRLSDGFPTPEVEIHRFRVLHPHGELAAQSPMPGGTALGLDDALFDPGINLVFLDIELVRELDFSFPTHNRCPDLPDLVPPGHDDSHIHGARSKTKAAIRRFIERADVIGSIGFSAQPPDDIEFKEYLDARRPGANTFWIGRKPRVVLESSDRILQDLDNTAGHFSCDVSEVGGVFVPWMKDRFSKILAEGKTWTQDLRNCS